MLLGQVLGRCLKRLLVARDIEKMAELAQKRLKNKKARLKLALQGKLTNVAEK